MEKLKVEDNTTFSIQWLLEAIRHQGVSSSNLDTIGYDKKNEILEISFLSGSMYQYFDVPLDVFNKLKRAQSKGKYFWRYIRNFYDYEMI